MSNNGQNSYGVSYSVISWLEQALKTHRNILSVSRYDDIIFDVTRTNQDDRLIIFCANEYVCGTTFVQRVLTDYPKCNIISVGGGWNGYTSEAKKFCLAAKIGLFVSDELMGALYKDKYWNHVQKDPKGDPILYYRTT
jgi:hypothetical protein